MHREWGHTRTGDNEIRVNEGWKKPRADGVVKLLSEMHSKTRDDISVWGKQWLEMHGRKVLGNIRILPSSLKQVISFCVAIFRKWMILGGRLYDGEQDR